MKAKFCKAIIVTFFFLAFISAGIAQTCELKISDPTPTAAGSYYATITVVYNLGGIHLVGSSTFYGLNPNDVNSIGLTWTIPIDTQANIYILRADVYDGNNVAANNNPIYSAWFNSSFYYNNTINVIATFN